VRDEAAPLKQIAPRDAKCRRGSDDSSS